MERKEFMLRVQTLVTPEDFAENSHLIDVLPVEMFETYLNCLKYGSRMFQAFSALDAINEACKSLHIDSSQVLDSVPVFRRIIAGLNCQDPPELPSRCCGRCDGVNDECVADTICRDHDKQGCEICYPTFRLSVGRIKD